MQRIEPKCIFQSLPHLLSLNYPLGPRTQLAWSGEQVAAITEASKSLDPCWTGKLEDLPDILKSKFTQKPLDFFGVLRNPQEDPPPEVWIGVREQWKVLADASDDDLLAALQPIKDVKVDKRSLL
jgi:hypothetical protein